MAEFGPNVTQVVGPQEAGTNPIAPVQEQLPASGWGQALVGLGQEVGSIAGGIVKQQRMQADQAFLKQLAERQNLLNSGIEQGTVSTTQYDTMNRHQYSQAIAQRPDLADKISAIYGVFDKTTVAGNVTQARQEAEATRTQQRNQAISQGYYFSPNMSQKDQDTIIQASQSGVKFQREIQQAYAANAEKRAQGGYDMTVDDNNLKKQTVQLGAQYAGDNYNAFYTQIQDLRRRMTEGDLKDNPQQAQVELTRVYGMYSGGLDAIGQQNPSLVAGWKDMFKSAYETAQKYLDPKADSTALENQLNVIQTKAKLAVYASNPKIAPIIATSQLLGPNNGATKLFSTPAAMEVLTGAISTPVVNGQSSGYRTPIVGNPEAEKPVLDALQKSIRSINTGGFTDEAKARIEAGNGINNVLVEVGRALNNGANPEQLKSLVSFFASDDYASWVKNGRIDPIAAQAAQKTFQIAYMPAVTAKIGDRLNQELIPASGDGQQTAISLAQGLNVEMRNGVLTFAPNPNLKLTPEQQNLEAGTIRNMQEVQQALNTMVHLGAHMEGTTDYAKHWEANKYYYLPQIYPVKPGQVVGNLKWSGEGDWRDKSTWSRVGQR
jgi:hypothetical protein